MKLVSYCLIAFVKACVGLKFLLYFLKNEVNVTYIVLPLDSSTVDRIRDETYSCVWWMIGYHFV